MEIWTNVIIVVIMGALNWFTVGREIKKSSEQVKVLIEAQVESEKRKRRWDVSSERLSKLSVELARMAARGERVVEVMRSMMWASKRQMEGGLGSWGEEGGMGDELEEALGDWNSYMRSKVFEEALFMQNDLEFMERVDDVRREYDLARYSVNVINVGRFFGWLDDKAKEHQIEMMSERIRENIELVVKSRKRIAEIQLEIERRLVGV